MKKRPTFVVIVAKREMIISVHGPYRSFKGASDDAKAWSGINNEIAYVYEIETPDSKR